MGLSDGQKSFQIGLAVLIQYRSVTASHPASHVAVAITLNAKASSLKMKGLYLWWNRSRSEICSLADLVNSRSNYCPVKNTQNCT